LKVRLAQSEAKPDKPVSSARYQEAQSALADAQQKLSEQETLVSHLKLEKEALQSQIRSTAQAGQIKSSSDENASLKPQLEKLQTDLGAEQERSQVLLSEKKILEDSKKDLESQLAIARSSLASERLSSFRQEEAARQYAEKAEGLERQRVDLQARLDVTSAELREARVQLEHAASDSSEKSGNNLNVALVRVGPVRSPAGSSTDNNAGPAPSGGKSEESAVNLAHLAAIQMDQGRLSEAEVSLKAALSKEPRNVMCLLLVGELRVRQRNFEAALEPLGLAAQIDPENAEAHNYLGLTLMEKGLGDPAEFALLRAVRLSPGYGDAHYNLAILYSRQKPPAYDLVRKHYRLAIEAGHAADDKLEGMIQEHAANSRAE
jgi:Tfp pilus assembly protein PilF